MCFNMARPEGFEPPTPAFVAQYSIQMNYGRRLNLRAYVTFIVDLFRTRRPPGLTSTRDGYHLGSVQRSLRYRPPRFPAGGSWTHLPFTVLVLRRNLDSVTSLADTLKTCIIQNKQTACQQVADVLLLLDDVNMDLVIRYLSNIWVYCYPQPNSTNDNNRLDLSCHCAWTICSANLLVSADSPWF